MGCAPFFLRLRPGHLIFSIVIVTYCLSMLIWICVLFCSAASPIPRLNASSESNTPVLDGTSERLFWFAHISDVHITSQIPGFTGRLTDFELWLNTTMRQHVRPDLIIVSGDIVDMKSSEVRSIYAEADYQSYRASLERAGAIAPDRPPCTYLLDVPGNHDAMGMSCPSAGVLFPLLPLSSRSLLRLCAVSQIWSPPCSSATRHVAALTCRRATRAPTSIGTSSRSPMGATLSWDLTQRTTRAQPFPSVRRHPDRQADLKSNTPQSLGRT